MPIAKALIDHLMGRAQPRRPEKVNLAQAYQASDGMPIMDRDDGLTAARKAADITAYTERGEDVPLFLYQGLSPEQITEALGTGGQLRGYGGAPVSAFMTKLPEPTTTMLPLAKPGDNINGPDPDQARLKKAELVDTFVQKNGYKPELFSGKSARAAAQIISDQLHARREAILPGSGWWSALVTPGV